MQNASEQTRIELIRLVLADDHAMLRQGTMALLSREPDFCVVAEAENGQRAVELAQQLKPDLVVMDVRMPVMSGIEATRIIRDTLPDVRVLVLTAHDDDQYVFSLLQSGASGYLLKTAPVVDLVKAIRQVKKGESPLSPEIARKVVSPINHVADASLHVRDYISPDELTARELEVLQMLARGLSNQEIAKILFISDRTVQAHLTAVFAKMQVASRLDAVLTGIRRGWLVIEPDAD